MRLKLTDNNVMVDLETMGTSYNAPIVSIGAVKFDSTGTGDEFYRNISLKSSLEKGLIADGDTIEWWMQQSDEARLALFENQTTLMEALSDFYNWVSDGMGEYRIWGNGATFDNVILRNAYNACLFTVRPCKYYNDMCYRTIRAMNSDVEPDEFVGTRHSALDDAVNQALHLIKIANADPLK